MLNFDFNNFFSGLFGGFSSSPEVTAQTDPGYAAAGAVVNSFPTYDAWNTAYPDPHPTDDWVHEAVKNIQRERNPYVPPAPRSGPVDDGQVPVGTTRPPRPYGAPSQAPADPGQVPIGTTEGSPASVSEGLRLNQAPRVPEEARQYLRSKLAEGYEARVGDVDGLHPEKAVRLAAFLKAAESEGHDIRVLSGARSRERQAKLWDDAVKKYGSPNAARMFVAPPGGSTHESGEAVDLQYGDRAPGLGGKRTPAVEWAHANARRFGLSFPLGHEDWHIEPVEARSGGRRYGGLASAPMKLGGPVKPAISEAITKVAMSAGMEPTVLKAIAEVESGGNPARKTGSYKGLFQLSEADFRKYGGKGSITDPEQNAIAAANKFRDLASRFEREYGRSPSPGELYLMHQQGVSGANAHFKNPDLPAWQNMAKFGSDSWAKKAIWGNLTPAAKKQFGSVNNVTSRDFVQFWMNRINQHL